MKRHSRKTTSKNEAPVLTIRQIRSRYKSEWVVVSNPKTDEALNVLGGQVVCHDADRDAVYRKAIRLRLKNSAIFFTGRLKKKLTIVL